MSASSSLSSPPLAPPSFLKSLSCFHYTKKFTTNEFTNKQQCCEKCSERVNCFAEVYAEMRDAIYSVLGIDDNTKGYERHEILPRLADVLSASKNENGYLRSVVNAAIEIRNALLQMVVQQMERYVKREFNKRNLQSREPAETVEDVIASLYEPAMRMVDRYSPRKGKFKTYSAYWLKTEVKRKLRVIERNFTYKVECSFDGTDEEVIDWLFYRHRNGGERFEEPSF